MKKIYMLMLLALLPAGVVFGQACFSGWLYRMPIQVTNPNATALSAHEVLITVNTAALISAGKMQSQGQDIRFTGTGCCDSLPYFIESGINTASTSIWVKVPSVPANGSATVYMIYGNAVAAAGSNGSATFSLFEGFDGNTLQNFSVDACGSGSNTVSGGSLNMSWTGSHILTSNTIFPQASVYTAEAQVVSASGDWPGIYWLKNNADNRGYGTLQGGGQVRISKSGTSNGYCQGHNWASGLFTLGANAGLWSTTWISTGNITGSHPSAVSMSTTDNQHARDADLRLCIGGISSGTGSISVDWVRARKYAVLTPTFSAGMEEATSFLYVNIPMDSIFICPGDSAFAFVQTGFNSYSWSTGATGNSTHTASLGFVSVTAVNALGCTSKDSAFVKLYDAFTPLDLGNDTSICAGTALTLSAGNMYNTYLWNGGQTSASINVSNAGTYSVTVNDINGCDQTDQLTVTLLPSAVAQFTSNASAQSQAVSFQNTSTGAATYSWDFGDGNTSALQSPVHIYTAAGTYTVCLTATAANGCQDEHCTQITVNSLGNPDFAAAGIRMFPNPAGELVNLVLPASFGTASVSICDAAGKTVQERRNITENTFSIDLQALQSGMYIIRLETAERTLSSLLIKK